MAVVTDRFYDFGAKGMLATTPMLAEIQNTILDAFGALALHFLGSQSASFVSVGEPLAFDCPGGFQVTIGGPNQTIWVNGRRANEIPYKAFAVPANATASPRTDQICAAWQLLDTAPYSDSVMQPGGGITSNTLQRFSETLQWYYVESGQPVPAGYIPIVQVIVPMTNQPIPRANLSLLIPTVPQAILNMVGESLLLPFFPVNQFGAKGDGVSDDTPYIQAAISAAEAAGGGIVVLAGKPYLIKGTLVITNDAVKLLGCGFGRPTGTMPPYSISTGTALIQGTSNTNHVNVNGCNGFRCEGVGFFGYTASIATGGTALFLSNVTYASVRDCFFQNCFDGIAVSQYEHVDIENVKMLNMLGSRGVYAVAPPPTVGFFLHATNVFVESDSTLPTGSTLVAFLVDSGTAGTVFENCWAVSESSTAAYNTGFYVENAIGGGTPSDRVYFNGCHAFGMSTQGMAIQAVGGAEINGGDYNGSLGPPGGGILGTGLGVTLSSGKVTITGVNANNNFLNGFAITLTGTAVLLISGCIANGNGAAGFGVTGSNARIIGNDFSANATGILIQGSVDFIDALDNDLRKCTTAPYTLSGVLGANCTVDRNPGLDFGVVNLPSSFPLTTVPFLNPYNRDVWLNITANGATFSAITIAAAGSATFNPWPVPSGTDFYVFLRANQTIKFTYAGGTPTAVAN